LIKISEGWYTIEEKEGKLLLNDLRFGQSSVNAANNNADFIFSFELLYDENGEFQAIERPTYNERWRKM
jgi:inner membrane protein